MRLGITGHQRLKDPAGWGWTHIQVQNLVATTPHPLIGVTSLAIGADQLFAEAVLHHRGVLEIIVPFDTYETTFAEGADRETYRRLLAMAARIEVLKRHGSDEEAFFAAGKRVVDTCERLIAVWDGRPAAGLGGTADVVSYARTRGRFVWHINPAKRTVETV